MDFGLKELGITFLVGAFSILGLELILYYFFNLNLTGFFQGKLGLEETESNREPGEQSKSKSTARSKEEPKEQTMRTAVFVGLAFAIGIIAEDLSYKHVDSIQTPIRSVPAKILPEELINTLDLPSKFDSRVKTLIIDPAGTPRPDWLAIDLGRSKAFSLAEPSNGPVVEAWIESAKDCDKTSATASCPPPPAGLHDAILRLYYLAKNKVYAQPHHYDELKRIQSRQEFSRSLAMIAFFYLVVGLLMLVPFLIIIRLNPKSIGAQLEFGKRHLKVAGVLGMLFCVFLLAVWAYERESDEFNKRAFGYFSSMLIKADQAEPDADRKAEDSAPKNPTSQ